MTLLVKELELARRRVEELELKAEQERLDALVALPGLYGFASIEEFEDAIREASGKPRTRKSRDQQPPAAASTDAIIDASSDSPPEPAPTPAPAVAQGIVASRAAQAIAVAAVAPANIESANNSAAAPSAEPASAPATPPKPLPTGTSLADPTQFGQLPDLTLLERGTLAEAAFRARLNAATVFAQQVLHTSRVPAAVWREWRDFTRKAADALRSAPLG